MLHMQVGPWPFMSIIIILSSKSFWPWSGQLQKQFQEYLCWKPFAVKTDNNPPVYILTTPNLYATQHHWVESLAKFMFSIEYQKGRDNAVTDVLSHVASELDAEVVKFILDGVTVWTIGRADAHDLVVSEADERIQKQGWGNCSSSEGCPHT